MIEIFRQELARRPAGAMPFVEAMELLLYHPQEGYYMSRRPRIGRTGDFVTASELTSLYGELLTLQFADIWHKMGEPALFQVVEVGAGRGSLALDVLRTARKLAGFGQALQYGIVERSPDFQAVQREVLADLPVTWHADLAAAGPIRGVLFGNEVVDAFPVHWLEVTADGLRELWVTLDQDRLVAFPDQVTPAVGEGILARLGVELPVGARWELGLPGQAWFAQAACWVAQGVLLMVDYGHPRHELYHPDRLQGTLVGYHQHVQVEDPLAWPGEMDITSHVDFTGLALAGQQQGLALLGFTSQSWFLMGLGLLERLAGQEAVLSPEAMNRLRQAVMRLLLPGGMGERFQVLAMGRGMPSVPLAGFAMNNRLDRLRLPPV